MKLALRKNRYAPKNLLCILLSALMTAGTLCACSGGQPAQVPENESAVAEESTAPVFPQYRVKKAPVSEGKEAVLLQQATEDGFLAYINRMVRDETPQELLEDPEFVNDGRYAVYESALFQVTENGKRHKIRRYRPLPAPENTEGHKEYFSESRARAFRMAEDGTVLALESSYESWQNETGTPRYQTRDRYMIRVLQSNGVEISCNPVEIEQNGSGLDCEHLVLLEGGLLAVPQGKAVLIFDTEGRKQFTVETPFPVSELCAAGEQKLAVILKENELCWLSLIDASARTVTVPVEIPADAHGFCRGAETGSICFARKSELFELNTETGDCQRLVSMFSLGVNPSEAASFFMRQDGTLSILTNEWDPDAETGRANLITAAPISVSPEEQSEKTVLTLGFLEMSDRLEELLIRFHEEQTAVRIEALDYGNLSEEQLLADSPDLFVMDEALYRRLSGERKLADLTDLLRGDRANGEGSIFSSVFAALKEEDGSLQRIAGVFRIESMACDADTVEEYTALSLDTLRELLREMPNGSSLYEPYYTSDRLLEALTAVNRRELVAGGQHNAALYEKLKAFAALQPAGYDYTDYTIDSSSMESRIYDGRLLMLQAHIGSLEELKWYDAFFPSEACFAGWPTESGSRSRICFDEMLGIGQHCTPEQREAAWQFVRMVLQEDYSADHYGFPVRVKALEKLMSDDEAAVAYRVDEDGEFELNKKGERIERPRSSWYSPEWRRHYEYALTEAQRVKLLQLIENAV